MTHNTAADRFWSKVDTTNKCWLWTGKVTRDGYGCFTLSGKFIGAHRMSYMLTHGEIPPGHDIDHDHRCISRRCVRPEHLRPATRSQNQQNRKGADRDCRSGIRGVRPLHTGKGWQAYAIHNGKFHSFGSYANIRDAETAAIAGRNRIFTHNDADRIL